MIVTKVCELWGLIIYHSHPKTTFLVDTEALTTLDSKAVYVLCHFTDLRLIDAPE